jgi:transposase-like protein
LLRLLDSASQGQPIAAQARRIGVAPGTLARWIDRGVLDPEGQRVRLEAIRLPGRVVVTDQAMERFLQALQGHPKPESPAPPVVRSTVRPEVDRADAVLEAVGW